MNGREAARELGSALNTPAGVRFFEIPLFSEIKMHDRHYFVQQRLGDQWVFIDRQNARPALLSDAQIGGLMSAGDFVVERMAAGAKSVPVPRSPLLTSETTHGQNLRKHAYVDECRKLGDHLRRSRSILKPVIKDLASRRGEKAPGFTTVLSWLDEAEQFGEHFGTAAYSDRHYLKGRRGPHLPTWQEDAIQCGIELWLSVNRMTKGTAYAKVCEAIREFDETVGPSLDKSTLPSKFLASDGSLVPPSERTFQRRCAQIDRQTRDHYKRGPHFAANNNRTYSTRPRPARPYEDVEVDHCTLDVIVVDGERGCIFGRPDVVVFRDRATAMIAGFSIGFEAPSYASFLEGLRHAIYPKSPDSLAGVSSDWPCYGRIENLWVDNAFHFIGNNIAEAGRELGINIERLPRRSPWMKGALERFFRSMGVGLLHLLPGTTLENVLARRDYENLGTATLTLPELEGVITKWICDDYHQRITKGLGVIRGHGDIPSKVWNELAAKCPASLPPNRDLFTSLAGDTQYRTVQREGIAWDYIKYESPELSALLTDPRHGLRREGRVSTKYRIARDPYRLGEISVVNHHAGEIIRVPATAAHHQYASSVTLHQHRVILARAREQMRGSVDIHALVRVRAELIDLVARLLGKRPKTVQKKLARFLQKESAYRLASHVVTVPDTAASDFLGSDLPLLETSRPLAASLSSQPTAPATAQQTQEVEGAAIKTNFVSLGSETAGKSLDEMEDLEEFKKRKAWSVSDGRNV
ncbi:integrase family protein [Mesorhizobium australicum WSM2073]|uniref:Integrase family protein n=1 Tax=Mesorhizobium australicum (strain HAMBI 3006 / LMG 24608 / WSM2073) TaxID=754035 RepID=L0KU69_MESAW|nr:Mu transposase C-terminal domain-containing protein [Mesorhizobium australicum]AGB48230.1 integrase family protein [Mesorhizobium australicum WSM2073]